MTATLRELDGVELSAGAGRMLEAAAAGNGGPGPWRARKAAEARRLLALAELAGPLRMSVLSLDLAEDLRAAVRLRAPVALRPGPDGRLRTASEAVLGILYPAAILAVPLPGSAVVGLLFPNHETWYPNVGGRRLCLGPSVPARTPVTELLLQAWGLLTLQLVTLDPADPAGVLDPRAAEWWQANLDLIPLTTEPFLPC